MCAFTLVEVVVATVLMILSLALFLQTFVSAKRSAVMADNRIDAVHNARMGMEKLMSYAYRNTNLNVGSRTWVVENKTNYYYVSIVTQVQQGGITFEVKNIALTHCWMNPATKATSTVSLTGIMCLELHPRDK